MQYLETAQACQPPRTFWVHRWLRSVQRVWPSTCVLCRGKGQPGLDICAACARDLPRNTTACPRCALPLRAIPAGIICGQCQKRPPSFDASFVPYLYAYPLDHLIQRLKFANHVSCGRVCGTLVARALLDRRIAMPDVLVPVPLGRRRYRSRGYNQAREIACAISRVSGVPVRSDVVERVRETSEQVGLKRKERRRNVRGAFAVTRELTARRIAIIDDVVTTGSTVNEIARVLRRAGALHIEVWAVARA